MEKYDFFCECLIFERLSVILICWNLQENSVVFEHISMIQIQYLMNFGRQFWCEWLCLIFINYEWIDFIRIVHCLMSNKSDLI